MSNRWIVTINGRRFSVFAKTKREARKIAELEMLPGKKVEKIERAD